MTDEIPPGWRATEYTREIGIQIRRVRYETIWRGWVIRDEYNNSICERGRDEA